MAVTVKLGEKKVWKVNVGVASNGTRDHNKLENRDAPGQHPMSAIPGLESALKQKAAAKDLEAHVVDDDNPHGLTAEKVGARPNTWMPSATDVGAAPAGYGLGGTAKQLADCDLNGIVDNGWYCYNKNAGVTNVPSETPSLLFVENFYNTNFCKQTVTLLDGKGTSYVRMRHSGTWMPWTTLAEAHGAAPASATQLRGYIDKRTDFNTVKTPGYYWISTWAGSGGANYPIDRDAGFLHVYTTGGAHGGEYIQQEYFSANLGSKIYRFGNAATGGYWSTWEYEAPTMVLGVEYRTTERWQGKAVYTKLIDCGKMPNNTQVAIPHGISMDKVICHCGYGGSSTIPYSTTVWNPTAATHTIDVAVSTYAIYIRTNYDASAESAMIQLWYTKA